MSRATALVMSGLDPTGGAGLLADISIIRNENVHSVGIPTALTVQTGKKVLAVKPISRGYFSNALEALKKSFRISGVKIGMVHSPGIAREIHTFLEDLSPQYVVLDPVIHSSYGTELMSEKTLLTLKKSMPLCYLITPNRRELKILATLFGIREKSIENAGQALSEATGSSVLLTGGHERERGTDYLFHVGRMKKFYGTPVMKKNFHGTGCALSSLIISHLVKGNTLEASIRSSKMKLQKGFLGGFRSHDGRWFIGM